MSKQRLVNKGAYIRNANLIGNGSKAPPIDGSFIKGIEQQRAIDRLIQNAQNAQSYSTKQSVNRVRKLIP